MSRGGPFFLFRAVVISIEVRPESHLSQGHKLWPEENGIGQQRVRIMEEACGS